MLYLLLFNSLFLIILIVKNKKNKLPITKSKVNEHFKLLLTESKKRLIKSVNKFSTCIKNNTIIKCMKKNNEVYKFKKIKYTSHIMNFSNGLNIYNILITPKINYKIQNIVIIPVAPTELIARTAIRMTWYNIKKTEKGKEMSYFFYLAKPEKYNNSYPLSLLFEEAKIYNDILLFDTENSYIKMTALILMCYKYVLENFLNCKYIIRVNSDMIFYPQKLDNMFYKKKDAIGLKLKAMGIVYLSGAFYVLSKLYVNLILNQSQKVIPISIYDDIYCGQINRITKFTNIKYTNKYKYYILINNINQNILYDKNSSLVAAHSVTSNALLYFWKYRGYGFSKSI